MLETIRVLYRELNYQMLRRNPMMDEEKINNRIKKFGLKKGVIINASPLLIFGSFMAPAVLTGKEVALMSLAVTLSTFAFIFSIYISTFHTSLLFSVGIFEPLKQLPLKLEYFYLPSLLLLDSVGVLFLSLPSVILLSFISTLESFLLLLWVFMGVLIGQTIGLGIFQIFGTKVAFRKTRFGFLKSTARVIGVLAFIGIFYFIHYLQTKVLENAEEISFIFKFSIAYPISSSSIVDPEKSLVLLIFYAAAFIPAYFFVSKRVWSSLTQPKVVFEKSRVGKFTPAFGGVLLTLILKDFRLVFRRAASIAGLFVPMYLVLPQLFFVLESREFPRELLTSQIFLISLFSIISSDVILKVEGKEIDFLRSLPLAKSIFALSKALSSSIVPTTSSLFLVFLAAFFEVKSLIFIPLAITLPLNVSLFTTFYLFRKAEDVGIPEKSLPETLLLFLLNGIIAGISLLPLLLFDFIKGVIASFVIASLISATLLTKLR